MFHVNARHVERKERMLELAGMLKEKGGGSLNGLTRILEKFCVQEGVKMDTAKEYLDLFKGIGLIKIQEGKKRWKYNKMAEWEYFTVNVEV